ncbi:hypothetical protein CHRYSEOSP005_00120 [Chryseobacterium sp. Alg-005]|uniref:hypothetical protein n=1 Tax=Chryseobacterium sp. Alg-005 TaxID=3159516 RepID=UPI0035559F3E
MPITGVTYQPGTSSLNSAYRPFIFRCKAKLPNATAQNYICPVVYCDIYVEGVYYKTLSRTQFINDENQNPEYEFDIQDAVQELMGYNLPKMEGETIETFPNTIKKIFVKFRNSYSDSNGFVTSEQPVPVQGTSTTPSVSGGGTQSNEVYVLNSAIQHEENQNLDELLASYQTGLWFSNAFPLTKRPKEFKICANDSSHFPFVSSIKPEKICVKAKKKTGEIIDLCNDLLEACPKLMNIQYTITEDQVNNVQVIEFTWTNPPNLPPVPYEVKIYRRSTGSTGPWSTLQFTANPTPITSQTMVVPFGFYDFVFEIVGACKDLNFNELPILYNVGMVELPDNNPPSVNIKWQDNNGTEVRVCTSVCSAYTILVDATDPDNDISTKEVFVSNDNGTTWLSIISNLTGNTFSTGTLSTIGTRLFKVVVTDLNNNTATSNNLSYTKQQAINSLYRKVITGISCTANGDSPTNYDVWCTGSNDFAFSDSGLINTSVGFIRLKVAGTSPEIGLTKSGGGVLVIDEVIPINTLLTASYAAAGQNPPSAYPWGYPANVPPVIYSFEYSANGTTGWTPFDLSIDD